MAEGVSWPVRLRGVIETVVTTAQPDGAWNAAALGVHAPESGQEHPRARTWGRTRTRRNFTERERGYVQFVDDPVVFVQAALAVQTVDDPVLDAAAAWVLVEPVRIGDGTSGGTEYVDWRLVAVEAETVRRSVPTWNRGEAAAVEASVHASRLNTPAGDAAELRERLDWLATVVESAGGDRARRALEIVAELSAWEPPD